MPSILIDTGLWYALFDRQDEHHKEAQEKAARLEPLTAVIAWPVIYETLNTRFVRNRPALRQLGQFLKRPKVVFLDDAAYQQDALNLALESSLHRGRPLSMVDCVLRLILDDVRTRIDYLATFNVGDFADVCRRRRIEML